MDYPFLQWGIWLATAGLELLVLRGLVSSRLYRAYPFLTLFVSWQVFQNIPG